MVTTQTIDIIDADENYGKIANKGHLYTNETFDITKNLPLMVITNDSGGTVLPSAQTGKVKIKNLSGNDAMFVGGTGPDAPYIAPNGISRGFELMANDSHDFPVNNGSALAVVARHSGQRINVIYFLNGPDVDLSNLSDPDPADFLPPTFVYSDPISGASGVEFDLKFQQYSGALLANFSEVMSSGTDNIASGSLSLRISGAVAGQSGSIAFGPSGDGSTLIFRPLHILNAATTYQFVIGSGITDVAGNPLGSRLVIPFTTREAPSAPVFLSSYPASGSTNIPLDLGVTGVIMVNFDRALVSGASNTTSGNISLRISGSAVGVSGVTRYTANSGTTMVLDPPGQLSGSKVYQVVVGSGIKEVRDNVPFGQTLTIPFTAAAGAPPADTTPPWVASFTPPFNAVGQSQSTNPQFVYSERIDTSTATTNNVGLWQAGIKVSGVLTISADNKTITFFPNTDLSGNTQYNIRASGVKDVAGNIQTAASGFSGAFTTVAVDVTPPHVNSVNPTNATQDVAISVHPYVIYNEALQPASVGSNTIALYSGTAVGGTQIAANVTLGTDNETCTIIPGANLANNTTYTVRASGVKDAAGNTQTAASGFSSTFVTIAQVKTLTAFYNIGDNGNYDAFDSSDDVRGGWFFSTTSSYIGKKVQQIQVAIERAGPGSMDGTVSMHLLDINAAIKQRYYLDGTKEFPHIVSGFAASKANYVWKTSGTSAVAIAANDQLILDISGATGTGSDQIRLYRNSSDVTSDGPKTRWVETKWGNNATQLSHQSGKDAAGILYELV